MCQQDTYLFDNLRIYLMSVEVLQYAYTSVMLPSSNVQQAWPLGYGAHIYERCFGLRSRCNRKMLELRR